jgi:hypothetical protein
MRFVPAGKFPSGLEQQAWPQWSSRILRAGLQEYFGSRDRIREGMSSPVYLLALQYLAEQKAQMPAFRERLLTPGYRHDLLFYLQGDYR